MSNFTYARCYENERWYLVKWSGSLLPTDRYAWSDETGRVRLDRDSLACPPNTKWISEWEADVDPLRTDHEGWMYVTSFDDAKSEADYANKNFRTANCRRRLWKRAFRNVSQRERDEIIAAYEQGNTKPGQQNMNNLFGQNGPEDSWQMVAPVVSTATTTNNNNNNNNNNNDVPFEQQVRDAAVAAAVTASVQVATDRVNNTLNGGQQQQQQTPSQRNSNPPTPLFVETTSAPQKQEDKKPARGLASLGASLSSTAGGILDSLFGSRNGKEKQEATPLGSNQLLHQPAYPPVNNNNNDNSHRDPNIQAPKNTATDEFKPDPLFSSTTPATTSPGQNKNSDFVVATHTHRGDEDLFGSSKPTLVVTSANNENNKNSDAGAAATVFDPFAVHTGQSHVMARGDLSKPDPLFATASTQNTNSKPITPFTTSPATNSLNLPNTNSYVHQSREEYHRSYGSSGTNNNSNNNEYRPDPLFASSATTPAATTNSNRKQEDGSIFGSTAGGTGDALFSSNNNNNNNSSNNNKEQKASEDFDDLLAKFM